MKWSRDTPVEDGWYWLSNGESAVVAVYKNEGQGFYRIRAFNGVDVSIHLNIDDYEWCKIDIGRELCEFKTPQPVEP